MIQHGKVNEKKGEGWPEKSVCTQSEPNSATHTHTYVHVDTQLLYINIIAS